MDSNSFPGHATRTWNLTKIHAIWGCQRCSRLLDLNCSVLGSGYRYRDSAISGSFLFAVSKSLQKVFFCIDKGYFCLISWIVG